MMNEEAKDSPEAENEKPGSDDQLSKASGMTPVGFTIPAWMSSALMAIKAEEARSVTAILRDATSEFLKAPPTKNQIWQKVVESRAGSRSDNWAVGRPSLQKGVGAVHMRFFLSNDLYEKMQGFMIDPPQKLKESLPAKLSQSFIMRLIIERDLINRGILREID